MTLRAVRRDAATAEFLDGAARGEFLLRRSTSTGELLAPQCVVDSAGGTDLEWVAAAGTGEVVTWAVTYDKPRDGIQRPAAVIAIVQLREGPWWWCELLDADPERMRAGLPVQVTFVRPEGSEEVVPTFRVSS